jgi:hypothetical protein
VQISAADTTGVNPDQHFIIGRQRNRTFGKEERTGLDWGWLVKNPGFHNS